MLDFVLDLKELDLSVFGKIDTLGSVISFFGKNVVLFSLRFRISFDFGIKRFLYFVSFRKRFISDFKVVNGGY